MISPKQNYTTQKMHDIRDELLPEIDEIRKYHYYQKDRVNTYKNEHLKCQ